MANLAGFWSDRRLHARPHLSELPRFSTRLQWPERARFGRRDTAGRDSGTLARSAAPRNGNRRELGAEGHRSESLGGSGASGLVATFTHPPPEVTPQDGHGRGYRYRRGHLGPARTGTRIFPTTATKITTTQERPPLPPLPPLTHPRTELGSTRATPPPCSIRGPRRCPRVVRLPVWEGRGGLSGEGSWLVRRQRLSVPLALTSTSRRPFHARGTPPPQTTNYSVPGDRAAEGCLRLRRRPPLIGPAIPGARRILRALSGATGCASRGGGGGEKIETTLGRWGRGEEDQLAGWLSRLNHGLLRGVS